MPYKDKEKARAAKNASYAKNKNKYLFISDNKTPSAIKI